MGAVAIMIDGEWYVVAAETAADVADGRMWIPPRSEWSLTYWILQLMLHGY